MLHLLILQKHNKFRLLFSSSYPAILMMLSLNSLYSWSINIGSLNIFVQAGWFGWT